MGSARSIGEVGEERETSVQARGDLGESGSRSARSGPSRIPLSIWLDEQREANWAQRAPLGGNRSLVRLDDVIELAEQSYEPLEAVFAVEAANGVRSDLAPWR
jgi:hypothetical protein